MSTETEREAERTAHTAWVDSMRRRFPAMLESTRDFGIYPGWWPLVEELCEHLQYEAAARKEPVPTVLQIKEKYGQLRFYIHGAAAGGVHDAVIDFAERLSARVCEKCGAPGRLVVDASGYWHTACGVHARPGAIAYDAWEAARAAVENERGG